MCRGTGLQRLGGEPSRQEGGSQYTGSHSLWDPKVHRSDHSLTGSADVGGSNADVRLLGPAIDKHPQIICDGYAGVILQFGSRANSTHCPAQYLTRSAKGYVSR